MFCDHFWTLFGYFFLTFFVTQDKTRPDKTRQDNTRKHDESCGFYHTNSRSTFFLKCDFYFFFKIWYHITQKTHPKHDPKIFQKCTIFGQKWSQNGTLVLRSPGPVSPYVALWAPKGHPRATKGPPRAPQEPPWLPFWSPKGPQRLPRLPFWMKRHPKGSILALGLPKGS